MAEPITQVLDGTAPSPYEPPRRRGRSPRTALLVALVVAVVVAWAVAAGPLRRTPTGGPTTVAPTMGTTGVVRTDVSERQQVAGTLGYAGTLTAIGQQAGTVTGVAPPGRVVGPGGELAEIDGSPVSLMLGRRPAWRSFALGMPDGPDVRQLESGLRSLGYDRQHRLTLDGHFGATTAAAVRRWQHALGVPVTGTVTLGSVVFLTSPIRVTQDDVQPGSLTGPGQPLVGGTTTDHEVTVALDAGRQGLVHQGDRVVVTMPDGTTTTKGTVTFVSRVAVGGAANGGGGQGGQGGGQAGSQPTVEVTVSLSDQSVAGHLDQAPVQVAITDQAHNGVLAVPVTALLAVPGGGFAVTRQDGTDIPVTVGLFDDLTQLVEVSGSGVAAGLRVQVPQT